MQCLSEELIKAQLNQYIEKMLNKQLPAKPRDKTKSLGFGLQDQKNKH